MPIPFAPERDLSLFTVHFAFVFENDDEGESVSFCMSCPEHISCSGCVPCCGCVSCCDCVSYSGCVILWLCHTLVVCHALVVSYALLKGGPIWLPGGAYLRSLNSALQSEGKAIRKMKAQPEYGMEY